MIKEETITLVNEQYNDAFRMTKEMNNVCKSADNAMCTMNTLRREFEEARDLVKELITKHAKINLQLAEMKTRLAKFLEGSVEDRIHAFAKEFDLTSDLEHSLMFASTTYVDLENDQAAIKEEIDKYETAANNKAKLIGGCHFAIRDLYVKFQNALAEAKQQKEAMAKKQAETKPKTITIMVDTSWPLSPREIQQAIDVLKAFKPEGEDGLGLKSAAEALEAFKKSVENHIEKHTKVVQDGLYFKLSTAE